MNARKKELALSAINTSRYTVTLTKECATRFQVQRQNIIEVSNCNNEFPHLSKGRQKNYRLDTPVIWGWRVGSFQKMHLHLPGKKCQLKNKTKKQKIKIKPAKRREHIYQLIAALIK